MTSPTSKPSAPYATTPSTTATADRERTNRLAEAVVLACTVVVLIVGAIVGLIGDDEGFTTDTWLIAVGLCAIAGGLLRHARPSHEGERGTRLVTASERATLDP